MKKLIALTIGLAIVLSIQAQTPTKRSWSFYTTERVVTPTGNIYFGPIQAYEYEQIVGEVAWYGINSTTTASIELYSSMFADSGYVQMTDFNYGGNTVDSVILSTTSGRIPFSFAETDANYFKVYFQKGSVSAGILQVTYSKKKKK
jgi:hypothetical protein